MASFDNLAPIEPWMFRSPTVTDPWYPDAFARETESALTKALQQSLFTHPISDSFLVNQSDYCSSMGPARVMLDPDRNLNSCSPLSTAASASTITGSGSVSGSGSDPETPGSKHRLGVSTGKTKKRKSRASKRATTTFIQADPANFRQMVQQVTGVKLGNGKLPDFTVVKPEPLRQPLVDKLLPTLDTSAYLLDLQERIPVAGSTSTAIGYSQFPARSRLTVNGGAGVDFYGCSSFPTLESSI